MMKKFKIFSKCFVFLFLLLFSFFFIAKLFNDGRVSAQTPIEISTLEDLYAVRDNLVGNYLLLNDLDFQNDLHYEDINNKAIWTTGEGWIPIGTPSVPFTGTFDGGNYKISNLFINRASNYQGLFGSSSGSIQHLRLTDVSVTGSSNIGGLVGDSNGTINNSHFTGNINATGDYTGGLVGSSNGTITNSHSAGTVNGRGIIGGIVGNNNNAGTVDSSYSTSNITATGDHVGGIVGQNYKTVSNSYSTGNISTTGNNVGGLVGQNYPGTINNSYSNANVTGSSQVGGLVGQNYSGVINNSYSNGHVNGSLQIGGLVGSSNGTVNYSYWDTQTSGIATSSGGIGKTTLQMKSLSTFNETWNILDINSFNPSSPSIWYIDDGNNYPRLFWQYSAPPVDPPPVDPPPEDPPPVDPPVTPPSEVPPLEDTWEQRKDPLPKTGIFGSKIIVVAGVIILSFGLVIYNMPNQTFLYFGYRERFERKINAK